MRRRNPALLRWEPKREAYSPRVKWSLSRGVRLGWLLLPAAAEGLVELDQREEFVGLGLGEIEFGGEIVGFVGKNFEVAGHSAFVANIGEARSILGGGGEEFLLLAEFNIFAIADKSIGNIAK